MQPTRRDLLVTIAVLSAPSAQAQQGFLTPSELDSLKALAGAIIPRTDTPGAADAEAHISIDRRLSANAQLGGRFREGLKALDAAAQSRFGSPFSGLNESQRIEVLTARMEDPFFRLAKDMTID